MGRHGDTETRGMIEDLHNKWGMLTGFSIKDLIRLAIADHLFSRTTSSKKLLPTLAFESIIKQLRI